MSRCGLVALHLEALDAGGVLDDALLSLRVNVPIGALHRTVRQAALLSEALAAVVLARVVAELKWRARLARVAKTEKRC